MIDIKLIRENRDLVKENIKKKFQDEKLGLVDEVYEYDKTYRECKMKVDELRSKRNDLSASIGSLMRDGKKDEAEKIKLEVGNINNEIAECEEKEERLYKLNEIINKYAKEANDKLVGKVMKVLLENVSEKDENMLAGYTDTMKLVNVKADKKYIGKIVNVKITDAKTWSLDGKIDE